MNKEFIPYEQALELKELGFDERCFGWFCPKTNKLNLYINSTYVGNEKELIIEAPLYQQVFRWFREKHKLDSHIKHLYKSTIKVGYYFNIDKENGIEYNSMEGTLDDGYFKSYEEAELTCLKKLIEIVANK